MVYLQRRDFGGDLAEFFDYHRTPLGIQPKLKLRINELDDLIGLNESLDEIIKMIILGPVRSNALAEKSVKRMLQQIKKPDLSEKLIVSDIPFRGN